MSAWIHSGNSSLDIRKKSDLPIDGNPLLATEKWFKKSLNFILAFQTHLPLLKRSGRGGGGRAVATNHHTMPNLTCLKGLVRFCSLGKEEEDSFGSRGLEAGQSYEQLTGAQGRIKIK